MLKALHRRIHATVYDPTMAVADRVMLGRHRRYLAADLEGAVLDLGAGTGAMFPAMAEAAPAADAVTIHAVEPDPAMRRRARKRAATIDAPVHLYAGRGEALPFEPASFNHVISSMVLCSVADPVATVDEIARVLRPGGEFRVLEHVAADGLGGRLQRLLARPWRALTGGCHLHRETRGTILEHDALDAIELDRLRTGIPPVRPFIRGRIKRRG